MFTGIIETIGKVIDLKKRNENLLIIVSSSISRELKIDQSVSHNGVCLTVIDCDEKNHTVEAVAETLRKTNLGSIAAGRFLNLERAMPANGRFDGHIVQGHVDTTAHLIKKENENGSTKFWFSFSPSNDFLIVQKGSICIDGVSLTVVDAEENKFSVVVIPFTLSHTTFQYLSEGDKVNIEFDILGKYIQQALKANKQNYSGRH